MGFENFNSDDSTDDDQQDNDPSGSYIHLVEHGHRDSPDDEEVAEKLDRAYNLIAPSVNGAVNQWIELESSGYSSRHELVADYIIALGQMRENKSLVPILDLVLGDVPAEPAAEQIMQFLTQNPEVGQEIESMITNMDSDEDETAKAEADD